jgi:hypothetical protein
LRGLGLPTTDEAVGAQLALVGVGERVVSELDVGVGGAGVTAGKEREREERGGDGGREAARAAYLLIPTSAHTDLRIVIARDEDA